MITYIAQFRSDIAEFSTSSVYGMDCLSKDRSFGNLTDSDKMHKLEHDPKGG